MPDPIINNPQPNAPVPTDSDAGAPPDLGNAAPPGSMPPTANRQPQRPPRETFGQGWQRGMAGRQYVVDAQGNVGEARTTAPSGPGKFGSILAGAVFGALQGSRAARPGGIPSHELSGGVGAGMAAGEEAFQQRDQRNRGRAQQDFANRNVAKKQQNEDLTYQADLHIKNLSAIKMAHEIGEAEKDDPLRHAQLVNAVATSQLAMENEVKNLGLINERTFKDYVSVPKADIDKFNRNQVKLIAMPDGSVKVWDRTFDARTTPNAADFEVKDLVGLDAKTGQPKWQTVGHVKAGQGTAAQQEAELDKERGQLEDAGIKNATMAKEKASTAQAYAAAELTRQQTENLKKLGVNVPEGFTAPPNTFSLNQADLQKQLVSQGVTPPSNFANLYAVGHYKSSVSTFPQRTYKGSNQMDQNTATAFIRQFVNPNYDQNNFTAVKKLEEEFASTRPQTAGGNLIAFNTATGHLGQLYQAAQLLENGDLTALNNLAARYGVATGKSAPQVFDAVKGALVGELGKTFKGAAPDIPESNEIRENINRAQGPQQTKDVSKTYAHLMLTKAGAQVAHYYAYTGELPAQTIDPGAAQVYQRMGINPQDVLPQGATHPTGQTGNQNVNQPTKTDVSQLKNLHSNGQITIGQDATGAWIDQSTGLPYQPPAAPVAGGKK